MPTSTPANGETSDGEPSDLAAIVGGAAQSNNTGADAPADAGVSVPATTSPEQAVADIRSEVDTPTADATPTFPIVTTFSSSNIVSAELGADGIVAVTFKDGKAYRYANFTPALMDEWKAAKSAGNWFHQNVRTKPDRHPVVESPAVEKAEQAKE